MYGSNKVQGMLNTPPLKRLFGIACILWDVDYIQEIHPALRNNRYRRTTLKPGALNNEYFLWCSDYTLCIQLFSIQSVLIVVCFCVHFLKFVFFIRLWYYSRFFINIFEGNILAQLLSFSCIVDFQSIFHSNIAKRTNHLSLSIYFYLQL